MSTHPGTARRVRAMFCSIPSALGAVTAVAALAGCGGDRATGPASQTPAPNAPGTYLLTETIQILPCSPKHLPAIPDSNYLDFIYDEPSAEVAPYSREFPVRVREADSFVSFVHVDEAGLAQENLGAASIDADGRFHYSETLYFGTEPPRVDGTIFDVHRVTALVGEFSGTGSQRRFSATGTQDFVFHAVGTAAGEVFSTCGAAVTWTAKLITG